MAPIIQSEMKLAARPWRHAPCGFGEDCKHAVLPSARDIMSARGCEGATPLLGLLRLSPVIYGSLVSRKGMEYSLRWHFFE